MTIVAGVLLIFTATCLAIVSFVHLLYLESLRLRRRDHASLGYFKHHLEEALQLRPEEGALAFALVKYLLASFTGILSISLVCGGETLRALRLAEATLVAGLVVLISSFLIPEFLYRKSTGEWLGRLTPCLRGLALAMRPLTALPRALDSLTLTAPSASSAANPEEVNVVGGLEALIEAGTDEGLIPEEDRQLIESVVTFGHKTVREVMTPRPKIVAIPEEATLEELRRLIVASQFSRIPVYRNSIDEIVGVVHVRDLIERRHDEHAQRRVREIMRPVLHVPETKNIDDLLRELQARGEHMAVVVDEYGQTAGIVTLEDVLEEIVGEIRDEHEPVVDVVEEGNGRYLLSGGVDVDRLRELFAFRKPEGLESTTVGGMVCELLGRVPKPGDVVELNGLRLEVLLSDERRVHRVRASSVQPLERPNRKSSENHSDAIRRS